MLKLVSPFKVRFTNLDAITLLSLPFSDFQFHQIETSCVHQASVFVTESRHASLAVKSRLVVELARLPATGQASIKHQSRSAWSHRDSVWATKLARTV